MNSNRDNKIGQAPLSESGAVRLALPKRIASGKILMAALRLARHGYKVFPCLEKRPHPILGSSGGYLHATDDPEKIREWWSNAPRSNIGIACEASGIVVLDVDPRHGGMKTLRRLSKRTGLDLKSIKNTPVVRTGSGGLHIYFSDRRIPKDARVNSSLGPGVDVKYRGSAIAPPSLHATGKRYHWKSMNHAPWCVTPKSVPKSLLKLLLQCGNRSLTATGKVDAERIIHDGQRNTNLTGLAGAMRRKGASPEEIRAALLEANKRRCSPPLPESEVENIIASVSRYEPEREHFPLTDLGNAERLVNRHGQDLRFCRDMGWLVWDGCRWTLDRTGEVQRRAAETIRAMHAEAAAEENSDIRGNLAKHARACEAESRIRSMTRLAETRPEIVARSEELDTDRMLLNVLNGTINLRTGKLRPHSRDDLITKLAPVEFNPKAKCPRWKAFLREVFENNGLVIAYVQRAVGYSITGKTKEQCWFFCSGIGNNGKSVYLGTIGRVLGDYAQSCPPDTFLLSKNEGIRNDLARLRGSRFVTAIEPSEGKKFNESMLKQFTGGDEIVARFLFKEYFAFVPEAKLWISANNKPSANADDYAFWRRVRLLHFGRRFEPCEEDRDLDDKLIQEEAPGILAWAVRGCLRFEKRKLDVPRWMRRLVEDYKGEVDPLHEFLRSEAVVIGEDLRVKGRDLYEAYKEWCDRNNEECLSSNMFTRRMKAKGFVQTPKRIWIGIAVED